ncbi:MAG TPA: hypothetical protein ENN88_02605, partial [Candidatus Coatesbacteria bacterium]|nr:hypothetical protein [Candidatus Coatesbacteria bacterium]
MPQPRSRGRKRRCFPPMSRKSPSILGTILPRLTKLCRTPNPSNRTARSPARKSARRVTTPSVAHFNHPRPRVSLVGLLLFVASAQSLTLPPAPAPESSPEELERDRLLEAASREAYLDSDSDRLLVATGSARRAESTPFAVTVITGARLRETAYTTLADALVGLAGLYPDWRHRMGQYAGLAIRCSPTQRVQVLVDGIPIDRGLTWFEALSTVPLNLVRRVEILRGPGGGLYRSGMGGVINVVTRNPQRLTLALAEAAGGGGSFNNQRYWGRFSNTVWLIQYKVGGYKWSHNGAVEGLERDGGSLDAEVRFDLERPEPGRYVEGAQVGLYARSFYARSGDRWSLDLPRWQDDVNLYHYGAFARLPLGRWGEWSADFRYAEVERWRYPFSREYRFRSRDARELTTPYYTESAVDVSTRLNTLPWDGGRLSVTLDGFWTQAEELDEVGLDNLGAALQLEQGLFGGMTQLVGAVRLDQNGLYGLTPTFRCGFLQGFPHPQGTDSFFINFADGLRLPTEEERERSSGLEPERGAQLESGVRLNSLAPFTGQLTAFYRQVSSAILPGETVVNREDVTEAYGGELELSLGPLPEPYIHRTQMREPDRWSFPLNLRAAC